MALTDLFTAGRIPRELVGRTLVLGDAATLGSAESFLHALAERVGPIGLGNLGPESYQGPFDAVDLPAAHGADRKRLKKLKPARLIVLGEADQRFDLVSDADCDKLWLNAAAPEVTRCGCRVVTVSGEAQAAGVPGAQLTGDPLLGLDSLPALAADAELCDRFREYRERNHPVFYVAMAGEDEENSAYGMLFEILRKKTTIMLFSLADPERQERIYHEAIKFSMPTIRHTRLYTSFVPKKNRVYFVEDAVAREPLYHCPDLVVLGGTLNDKATNAPDIVTPLLAGRPVLVGPRRDSAAVRAAIQAGVALAGEDVDALAVAAMDLFDDPTRAERLGKAGQTWVRQQLGARDRVMGLLSQ